MDDPEEITLKDMIIQIIKDCSDIALLDLIYKILTHE